MRRRCSQVTSRVLALLTLALLLMRPGTAVAAAPEYIWVVLDDDQSVLLPDWDENQALLLGEASSVRPEEGRPRYDLFLYWGADWRTESARHAEVSAANLSVANQRGYLYPAYRGQPALLVLESPESFRFLSDSALAMLEERGIPMAIADEVSRADGDGIPRAAVLVIMAVVIAVAAGSWPALRRRRRSTLAQGTGQLPPAPE